MRQIKRFRRVLRALDGMTVWVHEIEEEASGEGLLRQHLQDAVVIRLLDSGIKALGIGNVPEPPGNPWLNIFVNTTRLEKHFFYLVTIRLDEVVRLERNQGLKTIGTTWETSSRGVVLGEKLAEEVEQAMDRLIDLFVYDYQLENLP